MRFTENVVLQLHSMLYRYQPGSGGRWKSADNEIVERDGAGDVVRVRFTPTSAVSTPQAMADLVTHYQGAIDGRLAEPLVALPLAVLDFLCIHPFTDGNGRVARLLSLLLLYHFGYHVGRYISLERIIEESREHLLRGARTQLARLARATHTTRIPGSNTSGASSSAPTASSKSASPRSRGRRQTRSARRWRGASAPSASPTSSATLQASAAIWSATCCARCAKRASSR